MIKTVAISVHNNQRVEIFVSRRAGSFELWVVGSANGHRALLDHHVTHDDLQTRLEYAQSGDLVWRNAARSEIPVERHPNAVEMEETIRRGTFWDFENLHQSVTGHLSAIGFLMLDRAMWNAAKRAIIGRWTDGVVAMNLGPGSKLGWSCTDRDHPLNIGERIHGHPPDWWSFAAWRLHLMNNEHKCGTHVSVLRVDEQELHVESSYPHRIARVFHRTE